MANKNHKGNHIATLMHKTYLYQWINFEADFLKPDNLKRLGGDNKAANQFRIIEDNAKGKPQISHWLVAARRERNEWRIRALLKVRPPTFEESQSQNFGRYDKYLYLDINESGFLALPEDEPIYDIQISDAIKKSLRGITRGENGTPFTISEDDIRRLKNSIKLSLSARLAQLKIGVATEAIDRPADEQEILNEEHGSEDVTDSSTQRKPRSMSEDELLNTLTRQRENGAAGELLALDEEKKRLRDCGCSAPDDFVTHTSKVDVAAGYDIHSNWNSDQERFIEVKTTSSRAEEFFMSENEKQILAEKTGKSYIYIVDLDSSGADTGTLREPIKFDAAAFEFEPVAYRVRLKR